MPAVLPRRGHKLAAVLSVAVGALAVGVSSAQAGPIPCEWYDCVPREIVKYEIGPKHPECRCPDRLTDYATLLTQPELRFDRLDSRLDIGAGPGFALDIGELSAAGLRP